jgi:hypothetical protein
MKPQLADAEAERMLKEAKYIWDDGHQGYLRARRKGKSSADDRSNKPDVITIEELSDNGLADPNVSTRDHRKALDWLVERIEQGS